MAVPIQNIYYLLCYAWDRLDALDTTDVSALDGDRVENLLGKVLHDGVSHLIRRGLDRGYLPIEEEGRALRGKVLLGRTMERMLLQQGQVACVADELSHDVPHNRVLKAAMLAVSRLLGIDRDLSHGLRDLCRRMHDVAAVELGPAAFRGVQLSQNLRRYAFLVAIARLASESLLPVQGGECRVFRSFTSSDQQMGALFEAFVRNFLRREQSRFNVSQPKVPWDVASDASSDLRWLPEMRTDIVLSRPGQVVVVEAKHYAASVQQHYQGTPKLLSGHLYQLLAYLAHYRDPSGVRPVGVLLYAGVGAGQSLHYSLGGHTVLIRNLNLDQAWEGIRADLLALADELEGWGVAPGA